MYEKFSKRRRFVIFAIATIIMKKSKFLGLYFGCTIGGSVLKSFAGIVSAVQHSTKFSSSTLNVKDLYRQKGAQLQYERERDEEEGRKNCKV